MPARLDSAPRRSKRRPRRPQVTHAPVTDVQSGGGYDLAPAKRRARPKPSGPRSEAAAGGGYAIHQADAFRRTPAFREASHAAATEGRASEQRRDAVRRAKAGKAFNGRRVREAIALDQAPGLFEHAGRIFHHQPRRFLPDTNVLLDERKGGAKISLDKHDVAALEAQTASEPLHAAALSVLKKTAIPAHAIAGVASGHSPGYGVRHETTFGEILKDAGAPGAVSATAGFGLDVALDPTTYVTFGTGSVVRKAAEKEAERVAEKAAAAGMSEQGAATVARRAGERVAGGATDSTGVTVKFGGREVPGVRKASAATGRVVKGAAGRAPKGVRATGGYVKDVTREVRPSMAPAGAERGEFQAGRRAARRSRATVNQDLKTIQAHAEGLKAKIGPDNYAKVIDAIERGRIGDLPDELRQPAVFLRSQYRHAKRIRQRAGLGEGTITKRRKTAVPEITADVEASRKRVTAARRERARQERMHEESLAGFGVARGRAQILSRNVGGVKAERRAQAHTVSADVNQFAGGGVGVRQAADALQAGARNVAKARDAVRRAEAEHEAVVAAARQQRTARGRALKRRAAREGEAASYFPHAEEESLLKGLGIVETDPKPRGFTGGARTMTRPGSSQKRTRRAPISEVNPQLADEGKGIFSTDVPLVHTNYMTETSKLAARSRLWKDLADTGRRLKPKVVKEVEKLDDGTEKIVHRREYPDPALKDGEAIYHLGHQNKKFGLHEIPRKDWDDGHYRDNGKFVVLNKKAVDDALRSAQPAGAQSAAGRGYDKFTRVFKRVATATPGFHLRNIVGDTQMAYLSQPGHKLPGNIGRAGGALRDLSRQEREARDLAFKPSSSGRTVKIAGKDTPVEEFLGQAREHGVIRSGFVGRELEDLAGTAKQRGTRKVRKRVGQRLVRLMQNREDLTRLATFKHALDEGLKPELAADVSLETHIDYGDLTDFERRVMRRAFPFYTFSARALPFHAKRLAQRPGKFANIEKAREEIANATGIDLGQVEPQLPDYQQRQAPLVMKIAGRDTVISDALPLTLLNELPSNVSPKDYGVELGQFIAGLANPLGKDPVELYANKSFFFRDDIERDTSPLVNAPDWVALIPPAARRKLGIVSDKIDKRTGDKVWGWPAKLDYMVKAFPGPINAANQIASTGTNRRGQGAPTKILSLASGVKAQPLDVPSERLNRLYETRTEIEKEMAALRQRGVNARQPTPEYRRLQKRLKKTMRDITTTAKARGDAKVPGAPTRRRRRRSGFGGGGGGTGGGGGSGSFGGHSSGRAGGF